MGKFENDYRRLNQTLTLVEAFNLDRDMHAEEDLKEIRGRLENLANIKDNTDLLVSEFLWCVKMIESYSKAVDPAYRVYWLRKMAEYSN